MERLATMGFGEAARAFVSGWAAAGSLDRHGAVSAYDIKMADPGERKRLLDAAAELSVECADTVPTALHGCQAVFSLVTADRALEAADMAARWLSPRAFYFDCNSCSPKTKIKAARGIEGVGARYVDVAIMAPVHPKLHRTPLLLSGPYADEADAFLLALDMDAKVAGAEVGQASSIKMLRSVMIKGLEALTAECILAARCAGVERQVLASLQASDPGIDWTARSAYNLERMMVHGARRGAEMREAAATLRELGLPDRMALASAAWQDELAALGLSGGEPDLAARIDRILEQLGR